MVYLSAPSECSDFCVVSDLSGLELYKPLQEEKADGSHSRTLLKATAFLVLSGALFCAGAAIFPSVSPPPSAPPVFLYPRPTLLPSYVEFYRGYVGGLSRSELEVGTAAWPDLFESRVVAVPEEMKGMSASYPTSIVPAGSTAVVRCPEGDTDTGFCDVVVMHYDCEECEGVPPGDLDLLLFEGWRPYSCGPAFQLKRGGAEHAVKGYYIRVAEGRSVDVFFKEDTGLVGFFLSKSEVDGCSSSSSCSSACPDEEVVLRSCKENSKDAQVVVQVTTYYVIGVKVNETERECEILLDVAKLLSAPLDAENSSIDIGATLVEKPVNLEVDLGTGESLSFEHKLKVTYEGTVFFSGEIEGTALFSTKVAQEFPAETANITDRGATGLGGHVSGWSSSKVAVSKAAFASLLPSPEYSGMLGQVLDNSTLEGGELDGQVVTEAEFNYKTSFLTYLYATSHVLVSGQVYPRCWGPYSPNTVTSTLEREPKCVLKQKASRGPGPREFKRFTKGVPEKGGK